MNKPLLGAIAASLVVAACGGGRGGVGASGTKKQANDKTQPRAGNGAAKGYPTVRQLAAHALNAL